MMHPPAYTPAHLNTALGAPSPPPRMAIDKPGRGRGAPSWSAPLAAAAADDDAGAAAAAAAALCVRLRSCKSVRRNMRSMSSGPAAAAWGGWGGEAWDCTHRPLGLTWA